MNIGVFDSGLGGLWILKYLERELPNCNFIYFADQAHIPYGNHTPNEILKFSEDIAEFLISKNCKIIVIACNTATSAAISTLREKYVDIIFVGIEPAIKPAGELSKTGHIGVLATKVTAEGQKLEDNIQKFASNLEVHTVIGYELVELVEGGKADTDESEELLREYLEPLLEKNIDQLVLGCTHYTFLINNIKKIVGDKVNIIDPAPAIAKRVKQVVEDKQVLNNSVEKGSTILYSSSGSEKLRDFYSKM